MALFGISDTHLGYGVDKRMDIFGPEWVGHVEKLEDNWRRIVSDEDTVLMPGDISWGMRHEEAEPDLRFLEALPGKKIISRGNHDYWWGSVSKLNESYEGIHFLQNNFCPYGNGYALCATRGWLCPGDPKFSDGDMKIYVREQNRLRLSLDAALSAGYGKIILMLHYPPTNERMEFSDFVNVIRNYPAVEQVIFGHIHGKNSYSLKRLSAMLECNALLVSADQIDFTPVKLMD